MAIFSALAGAIGQGGSQAGGDMAWNAALGGRQDAQAANSQNQAEAKKAREAVSPWTSAGGSALNKISNLLGLGHFVNNNGTYELDNSNVKGDQDNALAGFQTSPGYQWRKTEGVNALDRSASAKGRTLSGGQIKAVQSFGDGLASDEYRNYIGDLTNVSGTGASATSGANATSAGLVQGGSNALVQGGNMMMQGGMARGSAYERGANAMASGISSGAQNMLGGAYMFRKKLGLGG